MKSADGRAERGYRSRQREGPPAVAIPAPGASVGDDPIQALVDGRWPDPDGGAPLGVPIESIVIERSLAGSEADLVRNLGFAGHVAIVFDAATEAALGRRVAQALAGRVELTEVRLPRDVQADVAAVDRLRIATSTVDALVAVGSGTINDVCKYAAAQDDKPYAVFATAPSMNGYASGNAAITVDGHKHTLAARAPKGVFVDLEVLAAAPPRLIRAGIGDSLCRPTAQVDWRLSHEVHGTRYRTAPFALLAPDEPNWRDDPEAVMEGDLDAMRALARTLILSGLGMTLCQGSYPASQGEHLVSHYIDMFAPAARAPYLHGEQVAVATLALARLQERMLDAPAPAVRASAESRATFVRRFGEEIGASCWTGFAAKALAPPDAAVQSERIAKAWPRIVDTLSRMAVPAQLLETALRRAGAPTTPAHIGLTPAFFAKAVREARFLRDRYTFLDLAGDAGTLDFAATN